MRMMAIKTCSILPVFSSSLACRQSKMIAASKGYHVIIINNFSVNVTARRPDGAAQMLAGGVRDPPILEGYFYETSVCSPNSFFFQVTASSY